MRTTLPQLSDQQFRALKMFAGIAQRVTRISIDHASALWDMGLLRRDDDAWTGYSITEAGIAVLASDRSAK